MLYSMKMISKPLRFWVIAAKEYTISMAHCNCMADLGESCNHVGDLILAIDTAVSIREAKTVNEEKAY